MTWNFAVLIRRAASVLMGTILLLGGATVATAQGKGKRAAKVSQPGGRPEIRQPLARPAKSIKPGPRLKPLKPKPAKLKPPKPPDKERHRAHKRCVKDCKRAHKDAVRACRGRTGRDRAACERAANEAHRRCMHGCPR
jgi:hypothetical protein